MTSRVRAWAANVLRLPGTVSFRRHRAQVRMAAEHARAVRDATDAELAVRFAALQGRSAPERLAVLRETASRTLGLEPYDEQLLACCALVSGHAVELDTGEGKTLVGALAAAAHVGTGRRVHILSVNDYLAQRDAEWMGPFFAALGVTVGWVGSHTEHDLRHRVYRCDVVYAPVSAVGFDVLRDRFAMDDAETVAPVLDAAIVDEADAVMIDEAMVPLVLAGSGTEPAEGFEEAADLIGRLEADRHYLVDGDGATVTLTDDGLDLLEARLGGINLYDPAHTATLTRLNLALHAGVLMKRDVDYLVTGGAIKLIDAGRGRIAHLQRWPDGLHAAVEAKEGLAITPPGVVLDTMTVQDLLRSYARLSGMSGTIRPVAGELLEFYGLPSGRVERHRPDRRIDLPDRIATTRAQARAALVDEVAVRHERAQPVLVGTQSVAESEALADDLTRVGIPVRVLNARNDADEAAVVARAGELGAVTISTQMSGRGTDIRLGGADERKRDPVVAAGGLTVILSGRYPSRRLDAQLRGRAARQGDPGLSLAIASLDDDLVRLNLPGRALARIERLRDRLGPRRRQRILDAAQRIAEGIRMDRHRATWAYSRAIAAQRSVVLARRDRVRRGESVADDTRIREHVDRLARSAPADAVASTARAIALHVLDVHWMDHLALLQEIRDGIHLRALIGQKPADEFHRIALREFHGFFDTVADEVAAQLSALDAGDVGRTPAELGLRRPSATWTYMVTDDPYGSPADRLARAAGRGRTR